MNTINEMMRLIMSKCITAPLYAAVKLEIPDILNKGQRSVRELASETGVSESHLYRILRALAYTGIFTELPGNIFKNSPESECFSKNNLGPAALLFLSDWHNNAWDKLYECLYSLKNPFETAHGTDAYSWLKNHPEAEEVFISANAGKSHALARSVINSYDFSSSKSVTDVGGGTGRLLIEIIRKYPAIHGTIADQANIIKNAEKLIEKEKLSDRCSTLVYDLFRDIPPKNDAYILCNILHNWDDEKSRIILKNVKKTMNNNSKLLIIEMIINESNISSVLMDLEMLVMGSGMERTESEFKELIGKCSLNINKVIPCGDYSILECTL